MNQSSITDSEITAANRRFDAKYRHFLNPGAGIHSSWNESRLILGAKLRDKQIDDYARQGFYSDSLKQARAAYQARLRWASRLA